MPSHQVPLNVFFGFQKVVAEILEHDNFVGPHGHSWRSYYRTHNIMDYLQIEDIKVKLHGNKDVVVPTCYGIYKQNISKLVHQHFGRFSISRLWTMANKGCMKAMTKNPYNLEEPWHICILTNTTKTTICLTIGVSKFSPGFMLQMYSVFFNIKNHLCIYLHIFVCMLCHFMPLWISIQKQNPTYWNPQTIPIQYIK